MAIFAADHFGGAGLASGVTITQQLGIQFLAVVAVGTWTAVATFFILKVINAFTSLRVSAEDETSGLDITQHEEQGYNL